MDMWALGTIVSIGLWIVGAFVTLLIAYLIVRLGVTHALRSHTIWLESRQGFTR